MKFQADHDLHIHSFLSDCSTDPEQLPEKILALEAENGFTTLCLTDHMWDAAIPGASKWYAPQTFEHISQALPLPQREGMRFWFGCETDMDRFGTIGISRAVMDKMDFIIVPTTHMHMNGFTLDGSEGARERAELWIKRFDALLDADLPFYKVGVAHLTCTLIWRNRHLEVMSLIPKDEYHRLFQKAAKVGIGIELNFEPSSFTQEELEIMLTPYRIAKEEGCKFYFGSDAHSNADTRAAKAKVDGILALLDLTEEDKIPLLHQETRK